MTAFPLFDAGPARFAFLICYEAILGSLARDPVRRGANLIVNPTYDGWFGDTAEPAQHLMLVAAQAAQLGVPILRAATTGISAFVDARGRIGPRAELFARRDAGRRRRAAARARSLRGVGRLAGVGLRRRVGVAAAAWAAMSAGADEAALLALEAAAFRAWPAREVARLGSWWLRFTDGVTRRANSVSTTAFPSDPGPRDPRPLDAQLAAAESFYRERNAVPRFQVTRLTRPEGLDARAREPRLRGRDTRLDPGARPRRRSRVRRDGADRSAAPGGDHRAPVGRLARRGRRPRSLRGRGAPSSRHCSRASGSARSTRWRVVTGRRPVWRSAYSTAPGWGCSACRRFPSSGAAASGARCSTRCARAAHGAARERLPPGRARQRAGARALRRCRLPRALRLPLPAGGVGDHRAGSRLRRAAAPRQEISSVGSSSARGRAP